MVLSKKERKKRYQGFALDTNLINEVRKQIKDNERYKSVAAYVKEAVGEKLHRAEFFPNGIMQSFLTEKQIESPSSHPIVVSSDDLIEFLDKRYGYKSK